VVSVNGYSGSCMTVRRASDNTTLTLGFVNGIVDMATADAWAAGSAMFVTTWFDQSGNGKNLTQATAVNQPLFTPSANWNRIRPVTFNAPMWSVYSANNQTLSNAALAFNTTAFALYMNLSPRTSFQPAGFCSLQNTGVEYVSIFDADYYYQFSAPGISNTSLPAVHPSTVCEIALSGGVTTTSAVNQATGTVAGVTAQALNTLQIGSSLSTTTSSYLGDMFTVALYGATHAAAVLQANNTAIVAGVGAPIAATKNIVFDGASLESGYDSPTGSTPLRCAGLGRTSLDDGVFFSQNSLPEWNVFNLGVIAQTLANTMANGVVDVQYRYQGGALKNIYVAAAPSNDIASNTYGSTALAQAAMTTLYASFLTYLATVKGYGFAVLVPTIIPRAGFALGTGNFLEDARVYWNTPVRNGVAAHGYTVNDRCAIYQFSYQSACLNYTWYYTDGIHLTEPGYMLMASSDRAAILSM
jgi:hypothetical protein